MTRTIQLLRGTTAQNAAFTGASGEVTVDTQTHELRVHDGSTVGGHIIYTKSDVDTALSSKADVATTLAGYGITDGANTNLSNLTSTGKANVSAQGTYDSGETYSAGTVGEAIQNKANVALDNITNAGKEVCANMSMPSGRFDNLTLGASGSTYTAPADGYFFIEKVAGVTGSHYMSVYRTSPSHIRYVWFDTPTITTDRCVALCLVSKGDVIKIDYTITGTTNYFRFYYANGAQ